MKSNFYENRKSLAAILICAAFLSGGRMVHAVNEPASVYVSQQTGKIEGTVVDLSGESVIGASVVVKGTTNGTITDVDWSFYSF